MIRRACGRAAAAYGGRRYLGDAPAVTEMEGGGGDAQVAADRPRAAPEVVLPRVKAPYMDFSGTQCDAMRGAGVVRTAPGTARNSGLAGREVAAPPEKLSRVPRHRLAAPWRPMMTRDLEPSHLSMREWFEEMLELHAETDTPAETLLRIYRCFPHLNKRLDEAFAVVFLKYHELAEAAYREGKVVKYFQSTVYPLFVWLRMDVQRRNLGPQVRRAMEMYLTAAADRGEVSRNHANYIVQNMLETEKVADKLVNVDLSLARGRFKDAIATFNDGEFELKAYAMLMQAVPDFFNTFPNKTPTTRKKFLAAMREEEVMYVLHSSFLLDPHPQGCPDTPPTMLERAKQLVSLMDDDDGDVLLIPHWTLHDLVVAGVDREQREDVAETLQFLAKKWSQPGSKVRYVWQSEVMTTLVHYNELKMSLELRDDKTLMFAKWLDTALPPLSEKEIQEHKIELDITEQRLISEKLSGYERKNLKAKIGSAATPYIVPKSQLSRGDVRQGAILLAHDPEVLAHCNAISLWAEPQRDTGMLNELEAMKQMKWYKFKDGLAATRSKKLVVARSKRVRRMIRMARAKREEETRDAPSLVPKYKRFKMKSGKSVTGKIVHRRPAKSQPQSKRRKATKSDPKAEWKRRDTLFGTEGGGAGLDA
eukprot:TRINITY_DN21057_c0_g1_i1.p1 TRINITY_DN21057_c0_g1~~TRINITY_DN21057_c0_g1_i1.p1  ORF type:complete len:648 (+),score=215.56 TRINITY_DN21057_c0_g1_i1:64-2007(+)